MTIFGCCFPLSYHPVLSQVLAGWLLAGSDCGITGSSRVYNPLVVRAFIFPNPAMSTHPLDGDGMPHQLYQCLCKSSHSLTHLPVTFRMPDTIVYQHTPISWFYFDSEDCCVKRRSAKWLEKSIIWKHFSKPTGCDVACVFYHRKATGDEAQFLSADELSEFMASSEPRTGLLQRFVVPNCAHNQVCQAIWTPSIFTTTRRTNRAKMADRSALRDVRCSTFEGPAHLCDEDQLPRAAAVKLKRITRELTGYFHSVDPQYEMSRVVAYFKEDQQHRWWLLFCTSIRIQENEFRNSNRKPFTLTPVGFKGMLEEQLPGAGKRTAARSDSPASANGSESPKRGSSPKRPKTAAHSLFGAEFKTITVRDVSLQKILPQKHRPRKLEPIAVTPRPVTTNDVIRTKITERALTAAKTHAILQRRIDRYKDNNKRLQQQLDRVRVGISQALNSQQRTGVKTSIGDTDEKILRAEKATKFGEMLKKGVTEEVPDDDACDKSFMSSSVKERTLGNSGARWKSREDRLVNVFYSVAREELASTIEDLDFITALFDDFVYVVYDYFNIHPNSLKYECTVPLELMDSLFPRFEKLLNSSGVYELREYAQDMLDQAREEGKEADAAMWQKKVAKAMQPSGDPYLMVLSKGSTISSKLSRVRFYVRQALMADLDAEIKEHVAELEQQYFNPSRHELLDAISVLRGEPSPREAPSKPRATPAAKH